MRGLADNRWLLQPFSGCDKREDAVPKEGFMKKIERILAPTDVSELSRLGLEYALELARGWGAEVMVYHVANAAELANYKASSLEDLLEKHKRTLSQFLNKHFFDLLPLVEVREKVDVGTPATRILETAEKEGSDLIVMSTHGRTGLGHVLMGSVTEQVVRNAVCPVFSVHPPRAQKGRET
jgi:nucleotide-binding universal stress UspA family protein